MIALNEDASSHLAPLSAQDPDWVQWLHICRGHVIIWKTCFHLYHDLHSKTSISSLSYRPLYRPQRSLLFQLTQKVRHKKLMLYNPDTWNISCRWSTREYTPKDHYATSRQHTVGITNTTTKLLRNLSVLSLGLSNSPAVPTAWLWLHRLLSTCRLAYGERKLIAKKIFML